MNYVLNWQSEKKPSFSPPNLQYYASDKFHINYNDIIITPFFKIKYKMSSTKTTGIHVLHITINLCVSKHI